MNEEWRPVGGFEGRYEVSNLGKVRSLRWRNRQVDRPREEPFVLFPTADKRRNYGYLYVSLGAKPVRSKPVHRLVLEAFVGPRPPEHESGHLDGNPKNNRSENLAWVTKKENASMRDQHGNHPRGEDSCRAKLTWDDVLDIRESVDNGTTRKEMAQKYGVSPATISSVVTWKTWRRRSTQAALKEGEETESGGKVKPIKVSEPGNEV